MKFLEAIKLKMDVGCTDARSTPTTDLPNYIRKTGLSEEEAMQRVGGVVLCMYKLITGITKDGSNDDYCYAFDKSLCPLTSQREVTLKVDILDNQGRVNDTYHLQGGESEGSINSGSAVKFRTTALSPLFVRAIRVHLPGSQPLAFINLLTKAGKPTNGQSLEGEKISRWGGRVLEPRDTLTFPVKTGFKVAFFRSDDPEEKIPSDQLRICHHETAIRIRTTRELKPR